MHSPCNNHCLDRAGHLLQRLASVAAVCMVTARYKRVRVHRTLAIGIQMRVIEERGAGCHIHEYSQQEYANYSSRSLFHGSKGKNFYLNIHAGICDLF